MLKRSLLVLAGFALLCVSASVAQAQNLLFDNYTDGAFIRYSSRDVGNSLLPEITVSTPVTLTSIAVRNYLFSDGNIKFLIYNSATPGATPIFSTAAKSFVADANDEFTYKQSDTFSFALTPGTTYWIGGIADVAGFWSFDTNGDTQNGITSTSVNVNNENFAAPRVTTSGGADPHVRLYSTAVIVPEANTAALLGFALPMIVTIAVVRRRTGKNTVSSPKA